jgi:prephenate dehydrogenase
VSDRSNFSSSSIGIIGFGAFGRLMAEHLRYHSPLCIHDPAFRAGSDAGMANVTLAGLDEAARCPVVILAMPVNRLAEAIGAIRPHLTPGVLVLDICSVKVMPAAILLRELPDYVDVVATHPLFGPQSARNGIAGLKIAVCSLRGRQGPRVAAFLRKLLRLKVIMTTPEAHDREAALVQGVTHLIAKVLVQMEPLPSRMTTRSFDLLMQAVEMVRHDAPEVFQAIEHLNPYSRQVRRDFFDRAAALDNELSQAVSHDPLSPSASCRGLLSRAG